MTKQQQRNTIRICKYCERKNACIHLICWQNAYAKKKEGNLNTFYFGKDYEIKSEFDLKLTHIYVALPDLA